MEIIPSIVTGLILIYLIIDKLWWTKEYTKAKDAQIESLKTQINFLQDIISPKIKEHFIRQKETLEEIIVNLEDEKEQLVMELNDERQAMHERSNTLLIDMAKDLKNVATATVAYIGETDSTWMDWVAQEEEKKRKR